MDRSGLVEPLSVYVSEQLLHQRQMATFRPTSTSRPEIQALSRRSAGVERGRKHLNKVCRRESSQNAFTIRLTSACAKWNQHPETVRSLLKTATLTGRLACELRLATSRHESRDSHISSGTLEYFLLMAFHTLSLLHFLLLHFPPLRYRPTPGFSTPAFSLPPPLWFKNAPLFHFIGIAA